MFFFNKRTSIADCGVFQGFTDWHCHLLPDVDDGVQTMDESLKLLALYEELGIRKVWLTPHIMEDMPNTTADLRERFGELQEAYRGNVKLHLAAENMLDNLFEERLMQDDLLPLGEDGKHLLVETSYFNPPMDLDGMLSRIRSKGYIPVLAHPERYVYMDEEDYRRIKSVGVCFQSNLPSLAGAYGEGVKKKAEWLLKEGLTDLWGTDTHELQRFSRLIVEKVLKSEIGNKMCSVAQAWSK